MLGIGAKIVLLVVTLVVVTAGSLSYLLINAAQAVMLDHEMTDLSDETDLRGWELADLVGETRLLFSLIGRKLEDYNDAPLDRRDRLLGEIRAEIRGWHTQPLAIEMLETVANDEGIELADGARQLFEGPAVALEQNASYRLFQSQMLSIQRESTQYLLTNANLEYGEAGFSRPELTKRREMFVLWIGGHIELPDADRPGLLLLMGLGMDKAMIRLGSTPRHLAFVFDQDGHVLLNPLMQSEISDREGRFNRLVGEQDEPFPGVPLLSMFSEMAQTDRGVSDRVRALDLSGTPADDLTETLTLPPDRTFYFLESEPPSTPLTSDEIRICQQVLDELRLELCAAEWRRNSAQAGEIRRVGGLSSNVATLRLMGSSEDAVDAIRNIAVSRLQAAFRTADPNLARQDLVLSFPSKPVECRVCRVRATRVNLVDPSPNSSEEASISLLIARGVFEEEIREALSSELEAVVLNTVLVAVLIAIVALYFGNRLTQPVQEMTVVAESVAALMLDKSGGSDKARRMRELSAALPLTRRDEIGVLARSFRDMLGDLLASQQALEDLNRDLENRVRRRTEELQNANEELTKARDAAQQLARNKDEFLANVSHELRTPLNWLYGAVQFLEMTELQPEQAQDVRTIRKATEDLRDLIEDILDYQKIIMDGMSIDLAEVEIEPLMRDVWDSLKMHAAKHDAALSFEFGPGLGSMTTDPKRLKQVIKNLGGNACKFRDHEGKRPNLVTVSVHRVHRRGGDEIVIRVADTGRGMKADELQRLFHKFERHAKDVEGTGLGLVITEGLIELMQGSIDIESQSGVGTTFTVRLPANLTEDRVAAELTRRRGERLAVSPPLVPPLPASDQTKPHKILVIDDDPNVREMMSRYLREQGYRVVTAADGVEGLHQVKRENPDLITLDVIMPELDGWAVLAALKTDAATAHIPVIMMTTLDDEDRGYALGAEEFLLKPIDWPDLARVLQRYCDRAAKQAILVVDDDPQTRALLRRQLEQDGWDVDEATHGEEALSKLAVRRPAAILLDLMMPVMDGFEFILEREKHPEWLDIPVIVVTAKDPSPEELRRLQGSVSRVLQKGSYKQSELLAEIHRRVDQHLNRKS